MSSSIPSISNTIAQELNCSIAHVDAVIAMLDEGATVPFIARYRKEKTGAMEDQQLRQLEERLGYLRELNERKKTILKAIEEQDKLTPELQKSIENCITKTQLEDLYLPYKQKRRTKAQIAIEAGLEPLADTLLEDPSQDPETIAEQYIDKEKSIETSKDALDGARYILMERFAEDASLLEKLRNKLRNQGAFKVALLDEDKKQDAQKFQDYFEYEDSFEKIPSHRMLAILRGRNEGFLKINIDVENTDDTHPCEALIAHHFSIEHKSRPADDFLAQVVRWTWQVKLNYQIESSLIQEKRQEAEEEAIKVFASNLKDLLLAAPAGARTTLGLDPGFRNGVKLAVVDKSGKIVDHKTLYPHPPQKKWDQAIHEIAALCDKHQVELISIGNGTASRETDQLVAEMLKKNTHIKAQKIIISEAGASIYSASEYASQELPDLDVTIRGAVSIARRLQDPLAELVKIDAKSIGVGQYQHDVNQIHLAKSLNAVVEDCVNAVGVDLNTASEPLLSNVSGLNTSIARNIVDFRQQKGAFKSRRELLEVSRLGPKAFEQAAGFLRIFDADNPLDNSSVHPESYSVVENMAQSLSCDVKQLVQEPERLKQINIDTFVTDEVGSLTLRDIVTELAKPGRDPRPEFKTASFKEGIEKISDLREGMVLQGVVSNVANFGAFVDIGVHQDGLVHISALANRFVKDPRTVVKTGDFVTVKVLEVDVARKRIGLTMRLEDEPQTQSDSKQSHKKSSGRNNRGKQSSTKQHHSTSANASMANALQAALNKSQ